MCCYKSASILLFLTLGASIFASGSHPHFTGALMEKNERLEQDNSQNFTAEKHPSLKNFKDLKNTSKMAHIRYEFSDRSTYEIFTSEMLQTLVTFPKTFALKKIVAFTPNIAYSSLEHNMGLIQITKGDIGFITLEGLQGEVIVLMARNVKTLKAQVPYLIVDIK